jgi:signal transduction histidine kinase
MTITRRFGIGYAALAGLSLVLLFWLGYHEFVEEPEEYAARGFAGIHKDTSAEASTVAFLASIPVLLCLGWWWMHRVLSPLNLLTRRIEEIEKDNLRAALPRSMNGDEVDQLSAGFNAMMGRLHRAFRQVEDFTLNASHELNTPLTVMRAQLEMALGEGMDLNPQQRELIESQLDEVLRLGALVNSLTFLTKADAGLLPLDRQAVALDELVRESFDDALQLGSPHGIEVTLQRCDETAILGNRHRLRQLLLVLVDNAVKYNRPGGTIIISLAVTDNVADLRITNEGDGIEGDDTADLFDRFVRGRNARGKVDGSGLGLSIARWIVQLHGGSVQLISGKDRTTTALVRLPTSEIEVRCVRETPGLDSPLDSFQI